jgi:cation-transporting ATPase I
LAALTVGVRFLTDLVHDVVHAARDRIAGRQVWTRGGRAHIEARGVHHVDAPAGYLAALEREVEAVDGVLWAAVNGVLGDVVVEFDPGRTSTGDCR